jgi:hypothetical protein
LKAFYRKLLHLIDRPLFRDGQWSLCECAGWRDNQSFRNVVAWTWVKEPERCLVVVNLSDSWVQSIVRVPWSGARGDVWYLHDPLSGESYDRDGDEMRRTGLYVELAPWNCYFFECVRKRPSIVATAA